MDFLSLPIEEQAARLQAMARKALPYWGISDDAGIELVKIRENGVFHVVDKTADKQYALRIHRYGYHSNEALQSELQWMSALEDYDVSTPEIIPALNGELFRVLEMEEVPEPRQIDIFSWVEGTTLDDVEGADTDGKALIEKFHHLGQTTALLHNHTQQWQLPENFKRHAWDIDGLLGDNPLWGRFWEHPDLTAEQVKRIQSAREIIRQQLLDFGTADDRYGLIHADLLPDNVMESDGKICVLDFDDAGFGWHLFDLSTPLYFYQGEDFYEDLFTALIDGYRTVRNLSDEHLESFGVLLTARSFTYLGWIYTRRETDTAKQVKDFVITTTMQLIDRVMDR